MPKSRVRKGRKEYRPRPGGGSRAPLRIAVVPPETGDGDRAGARTQDALASDEVARLQRRIIGSDAWQRLIEDHVVRLVNVERRKLDLPPLLVDERLRRSARAHSTDMADRGYFSHVAPDGRDPVNRMRDCGHPCPAAENIARGQEDPPAVMRVWMNSPLHRRNILRPQVRSIGVGMHRGHGGPWWTQHFGYE